MANMMQWVKRSSVAILISAVWAGGLVQAASPARGGKNFDITLPNGFVRTRLVDLQVDSAEGPVQWSRVWDGREWKFNPQWESLSQTWSNMTGSQSGVGAVASGSNVATPVQLGDGRGDGPPDGCWVMVDDDWQPSGLQVAIRTTPFNRGMSGNGGDYSPPVLMNADYASLCPGLNAGNFNPELEALRRMDQLFVGQDGRYAFDNTSTLEKRQIVPLPAVPGGWNPLAAGNRARQRTIGSPSPENGYRLINKDGSWTDYNARGQMMAWGDRNNNSVQMQRDTDGMVRALFDGKGHMLLSLHYTGQLLTEVRDYPQSGMAHDLPARSVKYEYDDKNRMRKVTDVRGFVTQYDYDDSNRLVKVTDAENRAETLEFDGEVVKKYTAADGGVTEYVFDYDEVHYQFSSRITGPETAAGRRIEDLTHDRAGKLVRKIVNGRVDLEVRYDAGTRTTISKNARGFETRSRANEFEQVVATQYPDGSSTSASYSPMHLGVLEETDEQGYKTRYEYDTKGNLLKMIEAADTAEQRITDYEVNAQGQTTRLTRRGRTEQNGTVTQDAVWQTEYDVLGHVSKTTDPENKVRKYEYDRAGNLLTYTDPLNHTTHFEVDLDGNLLKTWGELGHSRSFTYDKVGNLVQAQDARAKKTVMVYDAMNRRKEVTNPVNGTARTEYNLAGLPEKMTDADGRVRRSEFDNFLRLAKQIDGLGNVTEYSYNIADGSSTGTLASLIGPAEVKFPTYTKRLRYDQRDRPVNDTLINPGAQGTATLTTQMDYDKRGLLKTETDAYQKSSSMVFNAFGQPTESIDRLNNKSQMLYDARGNLIQVTDALKHSYKFEYDRNNRVVKEILPLGQTTTYRYDHAGNLQERVDPNGNKAVYSFDAGNRLQQVKLYQANGTLERTLGYTWDENNNLAAWTDTDHTLNQTAKSSMVYDDANRKTSETVTYPAGNTMSYGYVYSPAGYKTGLTWPDGTQIGYGYSQHGMLESVTIPGEGTISVNQFKWTAPEKITLPGGSTQNKTYDGVLNLESLKVNTPDQQTVLSLGNTYGKLLELKQGNRTDKIGTTTLIQNKRYTYDDENRLAEALVDDGTNAVVEKFTLDAVANRTAHSKQNGDWIYDENNRLIKRGNGACGTAGTVCYEYDDAGNTAKKIDGGKITQFVHNTLNQLVAVKDGANQLIARYGYDPLFRRIWKDQYRDIGGGSLTQAKRTYFLYSDEGLVSEAGQNITLAADQTVVANDQPVIGNQYGPQPDSLFSTGVLFIKGKANNDQDVIAYFQYDQNKIPYQATDKEGSVVWAAKYDAFGRTQIFNQISNLDKSLKSQNLRFSGQYEDVETGLLKNYFRDYEPESGRYLQNDPIGLAGGNFSTYVYVDGNPLFAIDPMGLYVTVVFSKSTRTLTIVDESGEIITVNAFTGGNTNGTPTNSKENPLPNGDYYLTENVNPTPTHLDWFSVLQKKARIDDTFYDTNAKGLANGIPRSGARFHFGTVSWGCITVDKHIQDQDEKWRDIQIMLRSTKKKKIPYNTTGRYDDPKIKEIDAYGDIHVQD